MIRILQCVNNMHRAGLEAMLMNYYRGMDRSKIQFDFLTHRPDRADYDDEIEAMGGRIYYAPRLYPQNYPAYFAYMQKLFAEHPEYRIVHSHIDAMSYLPLLAAKKAGVPVRIAHSHSTAIPQDMKYILKQLFRSRISQAANYRMACGQAAGEFLFKGAPFTVIPNAIDGSRFAYDSDLRGRLRAQLQLGDAVVIGHVGRFCREKNHPFLLKVFAQVLKQHPDSILLLVGTGETEKTIQALACKMGLQQKVRFLGSRDDVQALYQAMDVFVLPSFVEGVPMVGVEAQFAGLPCFFSDRVTEQVAFTEQCRFLPLELPPEQWAQQILEEAKGERKICDLSDSPFDIKNARHQLSAFYESHYVQEEVL